MASICAACIVLHVFGLLFLTSWFLVILKQDKIRGYAYKERLFNYIRKNRSKISIPGLTRPRHREKPADLEAGVAEDGDAEDKHTTPNDKGKAPERNPDADMKTDESVKKEWIPDWARGSPVLGFSKRRPTVTKAPKTTRIPQVLTEDDESYTSKDVRYALRYHIVSEHPKRNEGFPYITTRLHAACPRPPSNASRHMEITCSFCAVPPLVPLPHRNQPYPDIDVIDELLGRNRPTFEQCQFCPRFIAMLRAY